MGDLPKKKTKKKGGDQGILKRSRVFELFGTHCGGADSWGNAIMCEGKKRQFYQSEKRNSHNQLNAYLRGRAYRKSSLPIPMPIKGEDKGDYRSAEGEGIARKKRCPSPERNLVAGVLKSQPPKECSKGSPFKGRGGVLPVGKGGNDKKNRGTLLWNGTEGTSRRLRKTQRRMRYRTNQADMTGGTRLPRIRKHIFSQQGPTDDSRYGGVLKYL